MAGAWARPPARRLGWPGRPTATTSAAPYTSHSSAAVDCETYCRIRDHRVRQQVTVAQTARALGLDVRNVARWADVEQSRARKAVLRASKLDAFKGQIVR